jgi:hypothetical protein
LIIPADLLGSGELTHSTAKVLDNKTTNWQDDAKTMYTSVLVGKDNGDGTFENLSYTYYNRPLVARSYVTGTASDKVSAAKLRNPAWARRFAELMGEAAAVDLVVGRRSSVTGELMFDDNYEIVQTGDDGFPCEVKVTDHAGSFVDYDGELEDKASAYAQFALRRRKEVSNYDAFVKAYLAGFTRRLVQLQSAYRGRRTAFDGLFADRPYDTNGSGAYRWSQVLARLDRCDPERVASRLESAARC